MARTKKEPVVAYVIPARLNVREKPSGKILDTITEGTTVEIVSKKKDWCNIRSEQLSGWVVAEYLKEDGHA